MLGSCVTRDIFRICKSQYTINYYHARSSLLSLMSRPYLITEDDIKINSNFKKKVVLTDLNKDYFQRLKERESDYLIIDFIDERFAIYQIGFSYITRSSYFVEAGLLDKLGGRLLRKADLTKEWEESCLRFINQLKEIYPTDKIILHKAFFTCEYIDKEGNKQVFESRKVNIYKSINRLLEHYYSFFEKNLPGLNIIELPRESYLSWEGHEWGLAPMHYEDQYYYRILNELDNVIIKEEAGI
ncbi:DUF6270 domain-containing protein [Heyndrickxia sporothermodurans]|uniref:DUF6270 domain-containing protein n=1 Tax=Heyndrickxia sporothermodurans TaxID=46224 RepID=UPI003D21DBE9